MSEGTAVVAKRRGGAWKVVGCVAAILALLIAVTFFWINSVADRRWAGMERKTRELRAEREGRSAARPALRGPGTPGNAWDDYTPAIAEVRKIKSSIGLLGEFVGKGPKSDRAKVEALVAANGLALEHLQRGAGRVSAAYPYDWGRGMSMNLPGLADAQLLGNLAISKARLEIEAGRAKEGLELLLDDAQFGRDIATNSVLITEMIGVANLNLVFEELRDLVLSGKAPREALEEIDRGLDVLDRSWFRTSDGFMAEPLTWGTTFLQEGVQAESFGFGRSAVGTLMAWRYGFSTRLMAADAFDTLLDHMRRAGACESKPWAETVKVGAELQSEARNSRNYLVRIGATGLGSIERTVRECRARLRLVRAAARYRATGEVPDLDDPFGGKLLTSQTGDHLKIWSVGRDGADHGGVGGWKPEAGKDILLEVDR